MVLRIALLTVLVTSIVICAEGVQQQDKDYTVSVDVQLVQLPVSVLDRDGHPVSGLQKDHFQVFEDGVLQDIPVPPQIKRFQPAIVSRVKILSHLNIAEKRLPQDGRIKIRVDDAEVDIRVSVIPMLHGEAVVMRLLMALNQPTSLLTLGFSEAATNGVTL